jgi:hypothetical protein
MGYQQIGWEDRAAKPKAEKRSHLKRLAAWATVAAVPAVVIMMRHRSRQPPY